MRFTEGADERAKSANPSSRQGCLPRRGSPNPSEPKAPILVISTVIYRANTTLNEFVL